MLRLASASRLDNLAMLLQATNRFAEAEPLMRRALAIDRSLLLLAVVLALATWRGPRAPE